MDKKLLKRLFADGFLLSATVEPMPMQENRFRLVMQKHKGGQEAVTLARTEQVKIYQSFAAAVRDARDIGFKKVTVQMD